MNSEGKRLADVIKGTHKKLRKQYRESKNEETIWNEHKDNTDGLECYAVAMHTLATQHWDENQGNKSRVTWVHEYIQDYYSKDGLGHCLLKEVRKLKHFALEIPTKYEEIICEIDGEPKLKEKIDIKSSVDTTKLSLLDVGSCYNPFAKYEEYQITAIDLAPAIKSVKKCDFLAVETSEDLNDTLIEDETSVKTIKSNSFDVVVFSLFLEYIPSPFQRFKCCEKAYKLLKENGLLCIITPDSKHQNANVQLYKLWKITLEHIGFNRIKYEKYSHFHGMVFRKGICSKVWLEDSQKNLQFFKKKERKEKFHSISLDQIFTLMYIPQDFSDIDSASEK